MIIQTYKLTDDNDSIVAMILERAIDTTIQDEMSLIINQAIMHAKYTYAFGAIGAILAFFTFLFLYVYKKNHQLRILNLFGCMFSFLIFSKMIFGCIQIWTAPHIWLIYQLQ